MEIINQEILIKLEVQVKNKIAKSAILNYYFASTIKKKS